MKRLSKSVSLTISAVILAMAANVSAGPFEGAIEATLTRAGVEPTHYVFTRKGNQLRIENTTNKLEPINILDLDTSRLTIVYPHNTTYVQVDLKKRQAQSNGMPGAPTGMQPPPGLAPPATTGQIGPDLSKLPSPPPGFPSPPPAVPSIPTSSLPKISVPPAGMPTPPNGMPQMPINVGPAAAAGNPAMPAHVPPGFPGMPPMGGPFGASELKKGDKTRKIQGFECTLYTVNSRGENFEIYATNDSAFFPFQLITRDYIGRHFGPQMVEETWPELLRNKGLFPLEAALKMNPGGQDRLTFKIDKIEKKKIADEKLFQPPEKYIKIQAPQS